MWLCPDTILIWCSRISWYYTLQSNSVAPSGYYNITLSNGSHVEVYCDMEGIHGDRREAGQK